MYYQQSPFNLSKPNWKQLLKYYLSFSSILNKLIMINVIIYLLFVVIKLIVGITGFLFQEPYFTSFVSKKIIYYLSCPASFEALLLRPWTILTSIFFHERFWHIFFNMIMLSVVGGIFRQYLKEKHLLITYIIGGIVGNLAYILSYNFFPVFDIAVSQSIAMGASGGIMAILAAITVYRPNHKLNLLFIGPVKLIWITLFFFIIDFISIPNGNAGGHIAHIGGALYGAISVLFYVKFGFKFPTFKKNEKKRVKYATATNYSYSEKPLSDEEYNARKVQNQKRIDLILDKISQNGYESLSKEEKEFLFQQKR
ncbi:MAG: rhomboid family intramembrane serine protease [Bacteroidetes bacterium HGW-Bacteroidetes-19]|nr:MAG: rhomboid family intramembrane serine protease [Bacteroidetes bacterium HGW-Bacteroidetes-20]PKP28100.1 MAG: rhomboid family intramembrane serine protease [Bacteroidetes bacterium HGW-Bacteroidetes-19]